MNPASHLIQRLNELGNEHDALAVAKYHKVNRIYLGVRVPVITELAKAFWHSYSEQDLISTCEELWATDIAEARVLVGKLLEVRRFKNIAEVWSFINRIKSEFDAWAIADHLEKGAKYCILSDEKRLDELESDWLTHPNFWVRRACLVYTLAYTKPERCPERVLGWAAEMVDDHEWFIQKAIGWWLRELSKHNPNRVVDFLQLYDSRMRSFAVKEASKYLL